MKQTLAVQFSADSVDSKAAFIPAVSVLTVGKAIGHDFKIDALTLEQVRECGAQFQDGVRVKIEHGTGFEAIVGVLKSFRVDGDQLRADLHLIESHAQTPAILEMAEKMPGAFGLSIAFSGETDKSGAARCTELYSVDLVDFPAANPNGLFSARVDSKTNPEDMKPEEISLAVEKANEGIVSKIVTALNGDAKLKESVTELTGKLSTAETNLKAEQGKVTVLTQERDTAQTDLAAAIKERDELKAKVEKVTAEAKTLGAKEAAQINAALGVPPIEIKTTAGNPAGDKGKTELKGRERYNASIKIEGQPANTQTA